MKGKFISLHNESFCTRNGINFVEKINPRIDDVAGFIVSDTL